MCNKIGYTSKSDALKDAVFIANQGKFWSKQAVRTGNSHRMNAYECVFCGQWHLSRKKAYKKRVKRH